VRSVYTKVLVTSIGVLVFSFVVFLFIARANSYRAFHAGGPFGGLIDVQAEEAGKTYAKSSTGGLSEYLRSLEVMYPGTRRYLLDSSGRDLLTGANHGRELGQAQSGWNRFDLSRPIYVAQPLRDRSYTLLFTPSSANVLLNLRTYYVLLLVAVVLLGWLLAFQYVSPLNRLAQTVRRFGAGDLSARLDLKRRDELGELAHAFNQMAERIETLLTAERRLLQDISHELRSPLGRLSVAAELARTSADPDPALARIDKEVSRLADLIENLIQVTRAEGDPGARNLHPVYLGSMLADLIEDATMEAASKEIHFRLMEPTDLVLLADQELLRRALENVIRNAIRHAPECTIIEVEVRGSADNASISIRDYGPGVPPATLVAIFKPFFRVDSSRDTTTGGVGLGLAIAERAIRIHHGKVWAENAEPGFRVCIDLPVLESAKVGIHA